MAQVEFEPNEFGCGMDPEKIYMKPVTAHIDANGDLIFVYLDNTTQNVGHVVGSNGASAYQIAIANGFTGTQAEFTDMRTKSVLYIQQNITDDQKTEARTNIGAISSSDIAIKFVNARLLYDKNGDLITSNGYIVMNDLIKSTDLQ